jgi:hypothetical protein
MNNPMQSKLPMHLSPRCGAKTRKGSPCRSPAMAMTSSLSALAAPLKGAAFAALTREGMRFEQLADEAFKDVL